MARWMIGDIGVDRIEEIEGPLFRPQDVFPDYDSEVLNKHWDDLVPRFRSGLGAGSRHRAELRDSLRVPQHFSRHLLRERQATANGAAVSQSAYALLAAPEHARSAGRRYPLRTVHALARGPRRLEHQA